MRAAGFIAKAVDIAVLVGNDGGAAVDGLTHAVEDAPEHIARHGELERVTQKRMRESAKVDAGGGFKKLHDRAVAVHFEHFAAARAAVGGRSPPVRHT